MITIAAIFYALHHASVKMGYIMTEEQVKRLVHDVIQQNAKFSGVDPLMIRAMIEIESSRNPLATRYEPHLDDASIGLAQTLLKTAVWLASDMGYGRYGIPTVQDLMQPEVSVYFGTAYVNWLQNYRGEPRSEQWIVESYNGGPGNSNSQTQNHYRKYLKAKEGLN